MHLKTEKKSQLSLLYLRCAYGYIDLNYCVKGGGYGYSFHDSSNFLFNSDKHYTLSVIRWIKRVNKINERN